MVFNCSTGPTTIHGNGNAFRCSSAVVSSGNQPNVVSSAFPILKWFRVILCRLCLVLGEIEGEK